MTMKKRSLIAAIAVAGCVTLALAPPAAAGVGTTVAIVHQVLQQLGLESASGVPLSAVPLSGNGATVTASTPLVDLTQTWNNGAAAFDLVRLNVTNSAADATSNVFDVQNASTSLCTIRADGSIRTGYSSSQIQSLTSCGGNAASTNPGGLTAYNYNSDASNGDSRGHVAIDDYNAFAAGSGGGITFRGNYNTGAFGVFASIKGVKENATGGNNGGALCFTTQQNGSTGLERARFLGSSSTFQLRSDAVVGFTTGAASAAIDGGISRLGTANLAIGNGSQGDFSGTLNLTNAVVHGVFSVYKNITTAGWGVPAIYATTRLTAQTAANASITTYTPAADGSFMVSANVNITTVGSAAFSVRCIYTDETNTVRTTNIQFSTGAAANTVTLNAAGAFAGNSMRIRAKSGTSITVDSNGTFTGCTYNVEAAIMQVS
jgi:hypothetical protein